MPNSSDTAYPRLKLRPSQKKTILAAHYDSTEQRVAREAVVLAVQDTCELDYTTLRQTEGLGPIGNYENGAQGLLLHSTLTFNLAGTPLGLIDAQCWSESRWTKSSHPLKIQPTCSR